MNNYINIQVVCQQCSKPFQALEKLVAQGLYKFCSKPCRDASMRTRVELICQACGSKFTRNPSDIARGRTKYCSNDCSSKVFRKYPEGAEQYLTTKNYREKNKEKQWAHGQVSNAIKTGVLIKQPCIVCGDKAQAHHEDYTKPLDVIWLCDWHHKQHHHIGLNL